MSISAGADQKRVNRDVLVLTLVLWAAHFGLLATRAIFAGKHYDAPSMTARFLTSAAAAVLVYGIARLLRRLKTASALQRFGWACGFSLPAALLISVMSEVMFLTFVPSYRAANGGWLNLNQVELAFNFSFFLWVFVVWSALYANTVAAAEIRQRDRRLVEAESTASKAQLLSLRLQLHPHFLFNTLNTLSGLVALNRKKQAEELILNLSSFLRLTLAGTPGQLITLRQELEAQRVYLAIEQARYGERLKISIDVPDELGEVLVPSLILQPLLENAVKHSMDPGGSVCIEVKASRDDDCLEVSIQNPATAVDCGPEGFGIGLSNVRQRLAALYGSQARLEAGWAAPGVWKSAVVIPLARGVD